MKVIKMSKEDFIKWLRFRQKFSERFLDGLTIEEWRIRFSEDDNAAHAENGRELVRKNAEEVAQVEERITAMVESIETLIAGWPEGALEREQFSQMLQDMLNHFSWELEIERQALGDSNLN